MKDNIRYEELSHQLKAKIEKYYNNEKKKDSRLKIEDAMFSWFDKYFDKWVLDNYGNNHSNKRKYFRINIEIPVRIVETLVESSKEETTAMDLLGTIKNISRGGLFFKSNKYIEASSIIKVRIDLGAIDKKLKDIEALAMVLRCDKINKNEYGVGLMFSSIYNNNKQNLDTFIFRNVVNHINLLQK